MSANVCELEGFSQSAEGLPHRHESRNGQRQDAVNQDLPLFFPLTQSLAGLSSRSRGERHMQNILAPISPLEGGEGSDAAASTPDLLDIGLSISRETFSFRNAEILDSTEVFLFDDTTDSTSILSVPIVPEDLFSSRPPPASQAAIARLPHVRILPRDRMTMVVVGGGEYGRAGSGGDTRRCGCVGNSNSTSEDTLNAVCGVCCEDLMDGVVLTRLPCGHVYHINCIVSWLTKTCTCPECRYELETQDAKYERGRQERMKGRRVVSCSCNTNSFHSCFFRPKNTVDEDAPGKGQENPLIEAGDEEQAPDAVSPSVSSVIDNMAMKSSSSEPPSDIDMALSFCLGRF